MKYFHSLIITGFLISFLPLSAETALTGTSHVEFDEQREEASLTSQDEELSLLDEELEEFGEDASLAAREEVSPLDEELEEFGEETALASREVPLLGEEPEECKEEASLTSLDEELSLLDEEFDEFKEELFSLENDLRKQEKSFPPIVDNLLHNEKLQDEAISVEEETNSQNDPIAFDSLSPEDDAQCQTFAEADPSFSGERNGLLETAAEFDEEPLIDAFQVPVIEKSDMQMASETEHISEETIELADSDFLPSIEIAEPVKELAIDASRLSLSGKSNVKKETAAETQRQAKSINMLAADSSTLPIIDNADLTEESDATFLQTALSEEKLAIEIPAGLNVQGTSLIGENMPLNDEAIAVDLKQAFNGSPMIYSLLFAMSVFAVGVWLYSILSLRSSARLSHVLMKNLQNKLNSNNFDEALSICEERNNLLCKMISSGIRSRRHGLPVMIEAMKAEGKRASIAFWQKIGLLNDIAIIAPMLGLLGTVLGMFYAFYDVNRSIESISTLFDGLGISVGTTVAGLVVAILALILHSTAKYRLVKALALVENEAQSVATLIDDRTSIYKGS
jgi:biopolymer transport protein ExbB